MEIKTTNNTVIITELKDFVCYFLFFYQMAALLFKNYEKCFFFSSTVVPQ